MTASRLAASFVLIFLCVVSAAVAVGELGTAADVQAVRQMRKLMQQPSAEQRPLLERARIAARSVITSCKPQAVEAAIELDVLYADTFTPQLERDQWIAALNDLAKDTRAALGCQPTNGLIWARLAFAEWFLGRPADQQVRMLEYSELYAPAEFAALKARLIHWSRMTPYVLQGAKTSYDRDLWTLALWIPPGSAAELWKLLGPAQKQQFSQLGSALPADRIKELTRRGIVFEATNDGQPIQPLLPSNDLRPSRG